jgi:hypothetical protein
MAETFSYTVKTKPEDLLQTLKGKLRGHDQIVFTGDETSGHMKGRGFEGSYSMSRTPSGTEIALTISKKPFIIPWSIIESKLDEEARNW